LAAISQFSVIDKGLLCVGYWPLSVIGQFQKININTGHSEL